MKKLKQIIGDGLAITIPLIVIIYVLHKAHQVLQVGIAPIAEKIGIHNLFGKVTLAVLATMVMLAIILFMGLLMRFSIMRSVRIAMENLVFRFFPFLNEFKAMMADRLESEGDEAWKSVALYHGDEIQFAFLIEETEAHGTFLQLKGRHAADGAPTQSERRGIENGDNRVQLLPDQQRAYALRRVFAGRLSDR